MSRNQSNTVSASDKARREELINGLLGTQKTEQPVGPTIGERIMQVTTDSAATSLDTAAAVAGALTGAWGNAQQVYKLEANFRAAERQVRARRIAERYADRLAKLV